MSNLPTLGFQGGTLVLRDWPAERQPPPVFQWIKAQWRCEAYRYPKLLDWIKQADVRDTVPRWKRLWLTLRSDHEPHDYQVEALAAWQRARRLHHVGGSGATTPRSIERLNQWRCSQQLTH